MPQTRTRWPFFAALVIGIASVSLLWYFVLSDPKGEAVPASGGHYIEGVTRPPERMNPLFAASNPTDSDVASLVFSGLVRLGPDGTPQPDLAERWEITGNGQSYVFHLRRGIAWHDGANFDADDVVFTFNAIAGPGFKGDPALSQVMQGVVVTERDPFTVEFKLEQAYAPFLAYLDVGVLPKHLLQGMDANQLFNAPFNSRPIGTGPYRFSKLTSHGVVLSANPTFYLGPPRLSQFELRVYSDGNSIDAALRANEIDGALLGAGASRQESDSLRTDGRLTVHLLSSAAYEVVYLDSRLPLFSDPSVRMALWRAINPQALIADTAGGRGTQTNGVIPKGSWAYTAVDEPTFDPGIAASALERLGWQRGSDGVRQKGGERLAFTLSTPNEPPSVAIAESLARQWRAIGAEVTVQPVLASSYISDHLLGRKYQAALALIDPGPDPDPYPFWHSGQIVPPGRNLANYADSRIDDVLERARQTTDFERRKELYALFEGYAAASAVQIPLYTPAYEYVQATRVQGFSEGLLFNAASRLASAGDWYVEERVKQQ